MKSLLFFAGIILMGFGTLTSCTELNSLNLTDIAAPISTDFEVKSADSTGQKEEWLDATDNQDFVNNRSKIDNIEISKMEYQIKYLASSTADSLLEGGFEFINPATNLPIVLANVKNKKMVLNQAEVLPFDAVAAQQMVNVFKSTDPKCQIRFKASVNKKPVDFVVEVKLYLKLKVKI
jgi:hypothetical protein